MIANLQVLRALAAYLVVCHHAIFTLESYYPSIMISSNSVGAYGVDLFFVISGFVMMQATSAGARPASFMWSRIARVAPPYWLVTIAIILLSYVGVRPLGHEHVALSEALKSFAFLPDVPPGGAQASIKPPVLYVGWTLNYEMIFYLAVALSLFLRSRAAQAVTAVGLVAALVCAHLLFPGNSYLAFWGNTLSLEFVLGIISWFVVQYFPSIRIFSLAAVVVSVCLFAISVILAPDDLSVGRPFIIGLPAFLIVISVVLAEQSGLRCRTSFLLMQGNASYSLYLLHPLTLQIIGKVSAKSIAAPSDFVLVVVAAVMIVISGGVSTLFYRCIERPLIAFVRGRRLRAVEISRQVAAAE